MPRVTVASVNKMLAERGVVAVELVRGRGYFYFSGERTAIWPATAVYVYRVGDLSLDVWWSEYQSLRAAAEAAGVE